MDASRVAKGNKTWDPRKLGNIIKTLRLPPTNEKLASPTKDLAKKKEIETFP